MTEHEDHLRALLRESVAEVEPAPDALARLLAPPRHRRPVVLVAAALLVLVAGGVVVRARDEPPARVSTPELPAEALPPQADRIAAMKDAHLDVIDARSGSIVRHHRMPVELEGGALRGFTAGKRAAILIVDSHASAEYGVAWSIDLDTGATARLLEGVRDVAFSPDGSAIAYVPLGPTGRGQAVVRQLADGSERRFAFDEGDYSDPNGIDSVVWAPDSRQLAVIHGYYSYDTYVVDTTGPEVGLSSIDPTYRGFAVQSWPLPDELTGHHYCCAEAEPPDPAVYREGVLGLLDPLPPGATQTDANDLDGRPLTIVLDESGQSPTLVVAGLRLPGYLMAAW